MVGFQPRRRMPARSGERELGRFLVDTAHGRPTSREERRTATTIADVIRQVPGLESLAAKYSESDEQPFSRMLVKLKKEIIAFGVGVFCADRNNFVSSLSPAVGMFLIANNGNADAAGLT